MSDVDSAPFAIVDEGDPRMVRVTRPDGRSFSLPRAAAEAQGVEIRQPAPAPVAPTPNPAVTPERVPAPMLGAQAATPYSGPTLGDALRTPTQTYDPAAVPSVPVPPSTTEPAPTVEDVQRSFMQPGQSHAPTPAPAPQAQSLGDALAMGSGAGAGGGGGTMLTEATEVMRQRQAETAAPFGRPVLVATPGGQIGREMMTPTQPATTEVDYSRYRNQTPEPGTTFVDPPTQAAPRVRRPAPAPIEDDKPFDVDEQLIDQLIERGDGEALARVGEEGNTPFADVNDARTSTQTERALYRLDDSRRLQQAAAETQQAAAIDRQAMLERQQAETEALQAQRQQALGQAQRRYLDAYRTAQNTHVNPSRFYADRGVAGTIGIGIAMALGDVGAALTGGENRAAQIIEAAINRDMEAQRANQANAQAGVRNAQTFFDLTRQQFNDEEAALEAARSLAWNQVAQRTAAQMQGLASEEARINASALRDRAIAESQQAARAALHAEQDRELAMRRELLEQQGLQLENQEQGLDNARLQRRLSGAGVSRGALPMPRGWGGGAQAWALLPRARQLHVIERLGLDSGGDLSEGERDVAAAQAALDDLAEMVPAEGDIPGVGMLDAPMHWALESLGLGPLAESLIPGYAEGAELRARRINIIDLIGRLRSGAVIGADEEARYERMLGGNTEDALRRAIPRIQTELRARLGQYGRQQQQQQQGQNQGQQ